MDKFINLRKKLDASLLLTVLVIGVLGFLIFSSVYTVKENQVGILKTFGKASRITGAGIHAKLPYPLEQVTILETGKMKTLEIGLNSPEKAVADFPKEAAMLTNDDSLIWINVLVDWKISDPVKFISVVDDPEGFLHNSTLQIVRKKVGALSFNEILTFDRSGIETFIKNSLSSQMASYGIGISIEDVRFLGATPPSSLSEQFAKIDEAVQKKNSAIQNAKLYASNKVITANTDAANIIKSFSTYKEDKLNQAKADTAKFESLYAEYLINKSVTRSRLYFEMLGEILPNVKTIIIDGKNNSSTTINLGGAN